MLAPDHSKRVTVNERVLNPIGVSFAAEPLAEIGVIAEPYVGENSIRIGDTGEAKLLTPALPDACGSIEHPIAIEPSREVVQHARANCEIVAHTNGLVPL